MKAIEIKRFLWMAPAVFLLALPSQSLSQSKTADDACIRVLDMEMRALLNLLAKGADLAGKVSEDIGGQAQNIKLCGDLSKKMTALAVEYDIDWFTYAGSAYFSPQKQTETRFFPLGDISFEQAVALFEESGLDMGVSQIEPLAEGSVLKAVAPPAMIQIIDALLSVSVATEEAGRSANYVIVNRGIVSSIEYHGEASLISAAGASENE